MNTDNLNLNFNNKASASNKISQIGKLTKNIVGTKETLNISWGSIGMITLLGTIYIIAASIGVSTLTNCKKFKDDKTQENLNKVLIAGIGIALAIPLTLVLLKYIGKDMPAFVLLYSIMGIIATGITLNWTSNCEETEKGSSITVGVSLASFIASLGGGVYMLAK
jgi:hypothetical protein